MPPVGTETTVPSSPTTAAAAAAATFNLIELTVISAQDLSPSPRSLHTYAVTYLHPSHRLRTRVDATSPTSPTWNDKFLFRVDDSTFLSDTAAIQIDIYSSRPRFLPSPDSLLGTSRALLSTLHLSPSTRFLPLQVRRPSSLRPQGILNIAICLRSLPLYSSLPSSAFAYHDLIASKKTRKKKGGSREIDAVAPRLPQIPVMERSGSVGGGAGEKERVVLEKKLKKWRSEIWAVPMEEEGMGELRKGKARRPRAMSCFNLAAQYAADEVGDDDDSSRSSWSSNSNGQRW